MQGDNLFKMNVKAMGYIAGKLNEIGDDDERLAICTRG